MVTVHGTQFRDSNAGAGMRMGHTAGPTPARRPGDSDRSTVLIGHPPMVLMHPQRSGRMAAAQDIIDRICLVLVFILWVLVPVTGLLALVLQ